MKNYIERRDLMLIECIEVVRSVVLIILEMLLKVSD